MKKAIVGLAAVGSVVGLLVAARRVSHELREHSKQMKAHCKQMAAHCKEMMASRNGSDRKVGGLRHFSPSCYGPMPSFRSSTIAALRQGSVGRTRSSSS